MNYQSLFNFNILDIKDILLINWRYSDDFLIAFVEFFLNIQ